MAEPNHEDIREVLEEMRQRLLDLTNRNRLINFSHKNRLNLRIIDEVPDKLVEMLLADKEMRIEPVPEPTPQDLIDQKPIAFELNADAERPTAELWARQHFGLDTSYEVPMPSEPPRDRHTDTKIQTLHYPNELETRLKNLLQKADLAIKEMGTNILYLAFGFLEWFDNDGGIPRHAPLFLVPVRLSKERLNPRTKTYQYTLRYSGEDIIPNLSLREKLRIDFGIALPDQLDENTTPETYFEEVQRGIQPTKPNWQLRRYISLALFNFSKLLMYLDLNPSRWPSGANIVHNSLVRQIISGDNTEQEQEENRNVNPHFGEEYLIDEMDGIHDKYPLIYDADSSQHSAIIDATEGKNLVIEGPPGTGKSQTITNLIAAAMAAGKRVLFVAEKLAALEVVRRRLDLSGLGEFCLELHSHKSQKQRVLEEIKIRLQKHGHYRGPNDIDDNIKLYEEHKTALMKHALQINVPWKDTGLTLHEVLMTATRYRKSIEISPVELHPDWNNGNNFDAITQLRVKDHVQTFCNTYQAVVDQLGDDSGLQNHPWHGVRNTQLRTFNLEQVTSALEDWQSSLCNLSEESTRLADEICCQWDEVENSLYGVSTLLADLENMPTLKGNELLGILSDLHGDQLKEAHKYLELFEDIQSDYVDLDDKVGREVLRDLPMIGSLSAGCSQLHSLVNPTVELGKLYNAIQVLEDIEGQFEGLNELLEEIHIPAGRHDYTHLSITMDGLTELKVIIDLVADLSPHHWNLRNDIFDNDELDELLPSLRHELEELHNLHTELKDIYNIDALPSEGELLRLRDALNAGGYLSWLKKDWRVARTQALDYAINTQIRLSNLQPLLGKAAKFANQRDQIGNDLQYREALGDHLTGLSTDLATLESLRGWYKKVRLEYGLGFGRRVPIGEAIIKLPVDLAPKLRVLSKQGQLGMLLNNFTDIREIFTRHTELHENNALLDGQDGIIASLLRSLDEALLRCQPLTANNAISIKELANHSRSLVLLRNKVSRWEEKNINIENLSPGLDDDNTASLSAIRNTLIIATHIDESLVNRNVKKHIYDKPERLTFTAMEEFSERLRMVFDEQELKCCHFLDLIKSDINDWMSQKKDNLERIISRNNRALNNSNMFHNWIDYARQRDRIAEEGFAKLANMIEQGTIQIEKAEDAYYAGTFDFLASHILHAFPQLEHFSGATQKSIQDHFKKYDKGLKELQSELIAWKIDQTSIPPGNRGIRVGEHTERVLLEHEINKNARHIPIRQLLKRASGALVALKPCFMMGPMSVAQYLEPGQIEFDMIVMDEASQIRPQDALGAVARGKQLVVVGDPKQLPPTDFFTRNYEDDENNEDDRATVHESKSILDIASFMFPVKRRLRWHYRSQHETLIAFSNHYFYDSDLVVFPSPYENSPKSKYGIKHIEVPMGCFTDNKNLEEARVISEAVREHYVTQSDESIGVVAMNNPQRIQIEEAIESLSKKDDLFRGLLESDARKDEPLFIKNLENVQGDERDVIIISMTYGPREPKGSVPQRFGPINQNMGWRRLNVLFTRAKRRMCIYSSMGSSDVIISPKSKRGVLALRNFLAYCETGILHQTRIDTGRAPDSDFEIAVMRELEAAGFECVPQVGVEGFFIDLAVLDPENRGNFLMGIECDGATYHSAKSTRDRDRLRQEQLERLGWKIRRIWSTDWYRNPGAQLKPIIHELEESRRVA